MQMYIAGEMAFAHAMDTEVLGAHRHSTCNAVLGACAAMPLGLEQSLSHTAHDAVMPHSLMRGLGSH